MDPPCRLSTTGYSLLEKSQGGWSFHVKPRSAPHAQESDTAVNQKEISLFTPSLILRNRQSAIQNTAISSGAPAFLREYTSVCLQMSLLELSMEASLPDVDIMITTDDICPAVDCAGQCPELVSSPSDETIV